MNSGEFKMVTMDNVMNASFGETGSSIRATFKKTINVRQYETETYEASTTLELEREVSGIERMIISSLLQAQLEYAGYIQLHQKGYVSDNEFNTRKQCLEEDVNLLKMKGEKLLGKSLDYLF